MLKPLHDYIVVEVTQTEKKTASGIFLPDTTTNELPQTGKVIAVGVGKLTENGIRIAPEVNVGDNIIFAKYSGNEVKLNDKEYLILKEQDVLAIFESTQIS